MKHTVAVMLVGFAFVLTSSMIGQTKAEEYTNSGNGAGSKNSYSNTSNTNNTNKQSNSAQIINDINAKADTGGNSASGNNGSAKITTGDAQVRVGINNSVNQNSAVVTPCCVTPTQPPSSASHTPQPTTKPNATPSTNNPTDQPQQQGGIGGGLIDTGSPSNPSNASAPAILGLSDTASINWDFVTRIVGTLCVATGSILLTKRHASV